MSGSIGLPRAAGETKDVEEQHMKNDVNVFGPAGQAFPPSGDLAMGSHKLTGLANGSSAQDAAAFGQILPLTGGTMSGAIAMGTNRITGLGAPSAGTDAANKDYADAHGPALSLSAIEAVFLVDTGAANALVVTPATVITAYAAGQACLVKPAHDNTGAATIAVSGLTAQSIVHPDGTALAAGDMKAGGIYLLAYDGTHFQLLGGGGGGGSTTLPSPLEVVAQDEMTAALTLQLSSEAATPLVMPIQTADLLMWIKADAVSGTNGQPVTVIPNSAPLSAVTIAVNNHPTFRTNKVGPQPGLEFTGVYGLTFSAQLTGVRTVYAVMSVDWINPSYNTWWFLVSGNAPGNNGDGEGWAGGRDGSHTFFSSYADAKVKNGSVLIGSTAADMALITPTSAGLTTGTSYKICVVTTGDMNVLNYGLCTDWSMFSQTLSELIIFDRVLTGDESVAMEAYLTQRYFPSATPTGKFLELLDTTGAEVASIGRDGIPIFRNLKIGGTGHSADGTIHATGDAYYTCMALLCGCDTYGYDVGLYLQYYYSPNPWFGPASGPKSWTADGLGNLAVAMGSLGDPTSRYPNFYLPYTTGVPTGIPQSHLSYDGQNGIATKVGPDGAIHLYVNGAWVSHTLTPMRSWSQSLHPAAPGSGFVTVAAGSWADYTDPGCMGGGYLGNNTSATDGDAIHLNTISVPVDGHFSIGFMGNAHGACPIVDVYLDGVKKGAFDMYSTTFTGVYNKMFTPVDLGAMVAGQAYTIALVVNGHNVSSTGYAVALARYDFQQTS